MTPSKPSWRERALAVFPAGSNGEFGMPPELVPVIERGSGCRVWDTEGAVWLDFTMAWGSALVGHAHPQVLEAATKAAAEGFNYAAVNRRSVELAERLISLIPCAEQVRFVTSGTEATMMCLRVARAATGRRKVLKFEGAYHGQHPVGIASMLNGRPSAMPASDPSGTGAPWVEHDVIVAPFNDLEATAATIAAHADDLAAVIVEPFHRCISPAPGFLEGLRETTRKHGVVLVFDEVVTGFRFALGGAQEFYGVVPDLAAFGKAMGGGFSIGAYAGAAALMDVVNEHRLPGPSYAWSASTTGGNPVASAAAMAAIDVFSESGVYPRLHESGRLFRELLGEIVAASGESAQVLGAGPMAQLAFSASPVIDQTSWLVSDRKRGRAMMLELLSRKVFLNPMGTKLYLSLAHDPAVIREFGERLAEALAATSPLTHA